MSKFVQVKTQLRNPAMIKKALDDLALQYTENATYSHIYSGSNSHVPFLVTSGRLKFGLRPAKDGSYEVVGDEMQMRPVKSILENISQRYAYHMIVEETSRAGFNVVEESVGQDNSIHMTVRRWS